jgi:sulfur-oxidizing protein SoxX
MITNNITRKLMTAVLLSWVTMLAGVSVASADDIAMGKKVAFDRKKGNCLACHMIADGSLPGNIGPPLASMKARFPDKADLRAQIWDSTVANPNTIMPPFGKNQILSEKEVDLVTEFIYSL